MKFERKMSGTKVTDFDITPIFNSQFVWLSDAMKTLQNQESMDFLLDTFRFIKGSAEKSNDWCAILDYDSIFKISVLENYPEYRKKLENYFGENWLKFYIRFSH